MYEPPPPPSIKPDYQPNPPDQDDNPAPTQPNPTALTETSTLHHFLLRHLFKERRHTQSKYLSMTETPTTHLTGGGDTDAGHHRHHSLHPDTTRPI